MKEVQDRVVQFSNRYKLTNAETGEELGTFDFDEVTGTVQQVGTEINKALFDSIATDLAARVVSNGGELSRTIVTFPDIGGTAANVASGDTSATLWGKVKNWFSRLKALAFKDTIRNADVASNAAIAQGKISGLADSLAAKQNTITGAASTIASNNLTANRALVSNGSGKVGVSAVTATELGYLDGVTSSVQTQLNKKYVKPSGGIPASDLAEAVQSSLDKANSALQSAPVTSVAGKTGAVTLAKGDVGLSNVDNVKQYSASNPPPYPVTSVNNKTGAVSLSKSDVGLGNVDNVKQYSASNPPPYPVTSVNGQTGAVSLSAADDVEILSGLAFDPGFGQTSGNIVGYRIGKLVVITVVFTPGSSGIAWRDWALATGLPLPRVEWNLNPNPQYVGTCIPATPCALSADGITDVQFNLRVYEKSPRLWIHRCTEKNGATVGAGIEFNGTIVYVCQ